jgi:hypothetical protein
MDAITELVDRVPPLTLPPSAGARPRRQGRAALPRRRWGSWLAPVTAAAAVLAIAITLVAVRDLPGSRPGPATGAPRPAGAPVGFPVYYVTFSQPAGDAAIPVGLVLGQTVTGKKLFTLPPPHGLSFSGVTGAADDRTFVAAAHWYPYGAPGSYGRSRTWYLVRVAGTGSQASLTMTKLAIRPTPVGTQINSMSLSPDGTMLAVATEPITASPRVPEAVRVYSVATGAVLHSWSSTADQIPPIEGGAAGGGDDTTSLAWVGDHALAFYGGKQTGPHSGVAGVMELDLSRPDGDILASSRLAVSITGFDFKTHAPFACGPLFRGDIAITGDGNSFVCGGEGTSGARLPTLLCGTAPVWNTVAFAGFSLTTGKLTRFLSGYRTNCSGYAVESPYPVWVNATGSVTIGYIYFGGKVGGRFGAFSNGSFRPLPNPVPGNWYQYMAGSMLDQVAW